MLITSYTAIIQAAHDANEFGHIIDSNIKRIRLYISFIRKYDEEIETTPMYKGDMPKAVIPKSFCFTIIARIDT